MNNEEARTIGRRVRQIRYARRKSLRVIAGLAGMSTTMLHRIENGQRALDSLSETVALANALQVSPSDLRALPIPAPANGEADSTIAAIRLALLSASHDLPGGEVQSAEQLRSRVTTAIDALCRCEQEREVGTALPGLIRDLHATIGTGRDLDVLLPLAAWLHTQATVPWLSIAGAPLDLRSQAILLAKHAAQEHGDADSMGLVAAAGARVMLADGAFDLAQARLDAVTVPTSTPRSMQLAGFLALRGSVVASADRRPADVDAALEYAGDLAARTGEGNAFGLGFGPVNVGLYRMAGMVEIGDHEAAVELAESMNPDAHGNRSRRAAYWADYGRSLGRIRGRERDAVIALRRAELISPHRIQRGPEVRAVLAELLVRSRRDGVGQELRGMAFRAGLPV